jgi:hypothetical protein
MLFFARYSIDKNVEGLVDWGLHLAASYPSLMPIQSPIESMEGNGRKQKTLIERYEL